MGASRRGHSRIVELLLQVETLSKCFAVVNLDGDFGAGNHGDDDDDV